MNTVKRFFVSENGTTKIEYLVMVGCITILAVCIFQVASYFW